MFGARRPRCRPWHGKVRTDSTSRVRTTLLGVSRRRVSGHAQDCVMLKTVGSEARTLDWFVHFWGAFTNPKCPIAMACTELESLGNLFPSGCLMLKPVSRAILGQHFSFGGPVIEGSVTYVVLCLKKQLSNSLLSESNARCYVVLVLQLTCFCRDLEHVYVCVKTCINFSWTAVLLVLPCVYMSMSMPCLIVVLYSKLASTLSPSDYPGVVRECSAHWTDVWTARRGSQ